MTPDRAWALLISQPVAVLATLDPDGSAHLVPFTFAPLGRDLVSAVDAKPKRSRALRRLHNIVRDSRVTVLAHHYEDDWNELWWVRATGRASISDDPPEEARTALIERYPAYQGQTLTPWVIIHVERLTGWSAAPG